MTAFWIMFALCIGLTLWHIAASLRSLNDNIAKWGTEDLRCPSERLRRSK